MADSAPSIHIQVCYARPEQQVLVDHIVAAGTTIQQAIESSGIIDKMPEIDISVFRVGIYSKIKTLDTILREHDRVEIYRPLIADPKDSRRRRANKTERETKKPD
ncbi:MAG: RnfH family protein [Oxalicibacterium faecigallinarum]|uniref:RnfH family protein n=1 Tax=Oxalicibacterium faecigallinarum TaxID=573741 RepID=UPI002809A427|nr:RnfH family protein [Oxalicibacterium faecigallinarum]MDQ7970005.1 RnfH family protein [Oxalicibacterium faecigallinarum]